nr:phage holin family protein [Serratia sp. ASV30]
MHWTKLPGEGETVNEYLLTINAIVCGATAFRLMAYRRNGATHRPMVTVFAWLLIVASASVTIRTLTGDYHVANWSETLINVALCIAVVRARGNVMRIVKPETR